MIQNGKINILMVMANTRMGGVQSFVLNMLRNIDLNKYHIDFAINFYAECDGIEEECRKYGCEFFILPYFKIFNYFQYIKAWNQLLRTHKYDIVYAHATNSAALFLAIAKKYGIKTIAHSHSAGYRGNLLERLAKSFFAKGVNRVADYWFACSDKAAERLYGVAYQSYPYYFNIPNAIDAERYLFDENIRKRIRKQLGIREDTFLCGHLGTFSAVKNHKFLIDIFSEVLKLRTDSKLVCCGTGAMMPTVKHQVAAFGITDKVIFTGVVNNANEYMMAMDCFIFPSVFEGFPISVLEAQATGLPIVMHDVITKEVDLTELVHRASLEQPASEWAKMVINTKVENRPCYNKSIANSCYNIKISAKRFESLFSQLVGI